MTGEIPQEQVPDGAEAAQGREKTVTAKSRPPGVVQRPDVDYPALKNGLDYLVDVVDSLATDEGRLPEARALKYAVLHLQAGVEVLLKVRLQGEHWSLIFKKPENASPARFASGDFESCTTDDALARLKQIAGLALADKDVTAIKQLARSRNALTHYGLTAKAAAVEARAADVLNFLLPFITEHLLPGLDKARAADVEQTLTVVRAQLRGIESLLKTRMDDLRAGLKAVAGSTVICPECAQQALVITDEGPACRFCLKSWEIPAEAAVEYAWIVLGQDGPAPGEDEEAPVRACPNCEQRALVMEAVTAAAPGETATLCFSCAKDYTGAVLALCQDCGDPLPSDSEDLLCSECTSLAFGRF
ncbi:MULTISPECIES: hypothetical protein [unclassified Streptomyces]|uniref:hypothetical protein n=1 Tax=unclassified Streptomyces TaxID=2593676 RepID=UPI0033A4124E